VHPIAFIAGLLLILATLLDGFEAILLPRRISHRFRYSRFYYRASWGIWRAIARNIFQGRWREGMLSAFGPLSLLGLFGSWIASLVLGFTALQWSIGALLSSSSFALEPHTFTTYLYYSGTTYFTLGLGEIIPSAGISRALTVMESGLGFGFLAVIISYLPVLYQAFSKREVTISLLDARAGSPPTAGAFVQRLCHGNKIEIDNDTLREWERWCAELLESHLSFPVLAFYRSQHANQSWLASLTSMLDSCSVLLTLLPPDQSHQARLTFAMARHAAVDIALIFNIPPCKVKNTESRRELPADHADFLQQLGALAGDLPQIEAKLTKLRGMYEPFLDGLALHFVLALPPVIATKQIDDNWQRSAWMPRAPGIEKLPSGKLGSDHFD
jgi:hypothetical protein